MPLESTSVTQVSDPAAVCSVVTSTSICYLSKSISCKNYLSIKSLFVDQEAEQRSPQSRPTCVAALVKGNDRGMTKTDEEKANVLCDYFTEVFTEEDIANIPDAQLHE